VALGYQATTSAAKQIALGSSTAQVKISGAYTLPQADGSANQVLTTNGSGQLSFATASGGGGVSAQTIDIKTADYTVVSTDLGKIIKYFGGNVDRTVTLTAGATLGDGFHVTILNANSGADERVVIDADGTEKFGWSNGPSTITLSRGELIRIIWDNTGGRWIIGEGGFNLAMRSDINPGSSAAAGDGANSAIAIGMNAQSSGSQSVALGRANASSTDSFAVGIGDNTSSYGASGSKSIAIGNLAKATSSNSVCISNTSTASGSNAAVLGGSSGTASGSGSVALGGSSNVSDGDFSTAKGYYGNANGVRLKHATGVYPNQQGAYYVLGYTTSNDTPIALNTSVWTPSATNQIVLPNNSAFTFSGTIIAREDATDGSDYASWEIKGAIIRDANAASTVLGQGIVNKLYATSGASAWAIDLSAHTTFGCLKIQATGAAATNIRWVATVNTSEVTYA